MADIQLNSVTLATESGGTVVLDSATSLSGVTIPAAGITGTIGGGVTIPAAGVTGVLPNAVQDNITRLGTVTAGTLGSAVTMPDRVLFDYNILLIKFYHQIYYNLDLI